LWPKKQEVVVKNSKIISVYLIMLIFLIGIIPFSTSSALADDKVYKIGVTQLVTHPGIDAVRDGFIAGMKEHGLIEGKNVSYDFQNAQGQMQVAMSIAQKFVTERVDLAFPITTPSTQAMVKAARGTNIPIVFGAVTDPVAAGIVKNLDKPGGNVTGTSDVLPIGAQFELLKQVIPSAKTIGIVFNPGESNADFVMGLVEKAAGKLKLELVKAPVSNTAEVQQAAQSLVGRCDAMYSGASNTVDGAIEGLIKVSVSNKIPLLMAASSSLAKGGFGSVGFDYFDVGKKSSDLAALILLEGKKPGDIPVARVTNYRYYFNLNSAKATGVKIPEELLKKAAKVYK
jgi:putative ABC transport system substrate-binding protein